MMDLNEDQGSLTDWWYARRRPKNPALIDVEDVAKDIAAARKDGVELLFLDTPPFRMELIEAAIAAADVVVIPVRPSLMDTSAAESVVALCRKHRKPFIFLIAGAQRSMKTLLSLVRHELKRVAKPGGVVMDAILEHRLSYIQAMNFGKSVEEVEKDMGAEVESREQSSSSKMRSRLRTPQVMLPLCARSSRSLRGWPMWSRTSRGGSNRRGSHEVRDRDQGEKRCWAC